MHFIHSKWAYTHCDLDPEQGNMKNPNTPLTPPCLSPLSPNLFFRQIRSTQTVMILFELKCYLKKKIPEQIRQDAFINIKQSHMFNI